MKSKLLSPPSSPRVQRSEPEPPLKASLRRSGPGGRGGSMKMNSSIEQCAHEGDLQGAEQLLAKEKNVSLMDYNCVIQACARAKDPARAEAVFAQMEAAQMAPNAFCFGSLIHAYAQVGDAEKAQ